MLIITDENQKRNANRLFRYSQLVNYVGCIPTAQYFIYMVNKILQQQLFITLISVAHMKCPSKRKGILMQYNI